MSIALAAVPPTLRMPSRPLMSMREKIGLSITLLSKSCFKIDVEPVWLRCSDGAKPSVLPEDPSDLSEAFGGRQ